MLTKDELTKVLSCLDGFVDNAHAAVHKDKEFGMCLFLPIKGIGSLMKSGEMEIEWIAFPNEKEIDPEKLKKLLWELEKGGPGEACFAFFTVKGCHNQSLPVHSHALICSGQLLLLDVVACKKKKLDEICPNCFNSMHARTDGGFADGPKLVKE